MLRAAAIALSALAATACHENEIDTPSLPENPHKGRFVLATTVKGSNATSYVLLTAESLEDGSISAENNGLLNDGASQWVFHPSNYLYALTYNQGNAATTRSYILDASGNMAARDMEYRISRFTSFGIYNDYVVTMSTGNGPAQFADANGYLPKTLLMTHLDAIGETSRQNETSSGRYSMENYLGNGEYVTLAGIAVSGSRIFCGVAPMGLSQYGAAAGNGKFVRPGYEHLVKTADGGQNSSSYKKGELPGTQYPDECWVAIYADNSFTNPVLAKNDRLSYPCGRFKSQYYQTVWADDKGDVYVFSPSYAKTMTDPLQQTTHPAAVGRIPAGASDFDSYYCDIEALSGGKSFMRCWYAGGNCFLLVMYDRPLTETGFAATDLALFDTNSKELKFVDGMPENISAIGKNIHRADGKVYIPVTTEDADPAVYVIDTATATAARGLSVEGAADITGIGYLEPAIK